MRRKRFRVPTENHVFIDASLYAGKSSRLTDTRYNARNLAFLSTKDGGVLYSYGLYGVQL